MLNTFKKKKKKKKKRKKVYLKFCVYTPYAFKIIEGILLLLDNDLANEHTFCLKSRKRKKVDNFKLFLKMLYIDMML
ncbi:hypothetical protein PFBG_03771 [Plasmodium falciparum 7G8]|uniref:Uncharacterized protein n=1 Tax=Plasmodium falciparum (isolate 7G8) TaxID=57266 RepID=W7EY55_PLAF8|nr:hypothetical protein PFBG_03771 [Plasmodium falciparum 7G8]